MPVRIQVPDLDGYDRFNIFKLALFSAIIGAMFFGTAFLFSPDTPNIAISQLTGGSKDSPTSTQNPANDADIMESQSPRIFATVMFGSLAALFLLYAFREVLIVIFTTLLLVDIGFVLAGLYLIFCVFLFAFKTFQVGGFYGLVPLLVLAVECGLVYLSYRFAIHHILPLEDIPFA